MGKDKKRKEDENQKSTSLFYYEIIGIILIVFSIVVLGKLGELGRLLTIFFKIGFGDWYWFLIIFTLILGFYNLFVHKAFNFKNQRFIGFVFFTIGLLVFSHFSMHNYVNASDSNYFSATWQIYKSYITVQTDIYLGGGMFGAIIFYIAYYMVGKVGVALISALIMVFGLSLLINKSITEIITFMTKRLKNIKEYTSNFNNFFKYELGSWKKKEKRVDVFSKSRQVPLKIFEDYRNPISKSIQEKISFDTKSLIHSIFSNMYLEYRDESLIVSYQVTTYKFTIYTDFDMNILFSHIRKVVEEDILIGQNKSNLLIQIENKQKDICTNRNLLIKQNSLYNNYIMPLGISFDNKLIELDMGQSENIALIGSYNVGIRNFICYYITTMFVKNNLLNYVFEVHDVHQELDNISAITKTATNKDINSYLEEVKFEIDERLELFKKANVTQIGEYNKKIEIENSNVAILKKKFIIINRVDLDKEETAYFESKLMYVGQLGAKTGVTIIYVVRNEMQYTSIISSLFESKILFYTEEAEFSKKVIGNANATHLLKNGDCYYIYRGQIRRMQTALISRKDLESVKSYLN